MESSHKGERSFYTKENKVTHSRFECCSNKQRSSEQKIETIKKVPGPSAKTEVTAGGVRGGGMVGWADPEHKRGGHGAGEKGGGWRGEEVPQGSRLQYWIFLCYAVL